jgi:hypothetical protein
MATWEDVRRLALALPETAEESSRDGRLAWSVRGKTFAWERPLRPADCRGYRSRCGSADRITSWPPKRSSSGAPRMSGTSSRTRASARGT